MFTRARATLYFFSLLLGTTSTVALAGAGWTDAGLIVNLSQQPAVGAGANLVFLQVNVTVNPSDATACYTRNGFYFSVSDDRRKRLFATLLASQMASRTVAIYTTGTCHAWGYAELDGLVGQ